MDQISNKLIDKINTPIIKLNKVFVASKSFLDATVQKQAAELLALQELTKQQSDLVKLLTDSTEKMSNAFNTRGLLETAWPHLQILFPPQVPSVQLNINATPRQCACRPKSHTASRPHL